MNKKGFTLVEILAVIVILSIIMIIAVPTINSVSAATKRKMLQNKITFAKQALTLWAEDNKKCIVSPTSDCLTMTCSGSTTRTCTVTFGNMAAYGLIDYDDNNNVLNPINKTPINSETITFTYETSTKNIKIKTVSISI